ncbi:hypothetical protein DYB32_006409 [Aphanomyces invadans]|uniref:Protein kinase domain-containing protein n=1 Tax=Aphanomyces invadans TaxID=157072 RepID=A0A3R6ZN73_9STRA|nr:hypothetical protein DYB32_006409 [Aphanomyces invadans]
MLDDRKVFLKCIDFTQTCSSAKHAFLEDAVWIQALEHPHIVRVLGFTVVAYSTTFCVVLEFMEQGTLASRLRSPTLFSGAVMSTSQNGGRRPPSNVAQDEKLIAYQKCLELAIGLHYLHSQQIPYKVISASNILVHDNQYKWNIQQLMRCRPKHCSRRGVVGAEGERYGTGDVVYAAPELLSSTEPVDNFAADIYALAIVFGEIVTQTPPFANVYEALGPVAGDAHVATVKANPASSLEDLAPFLDWLPAEDVSTTTSTTTKGLSFEALVRKCLDANPASRPTIDLVVLALVPLAENPRFHVEP